MAPSPPSAGATATGGGAIRALWPDGDDIIVPSLAADLRKPGDKTPMAAGGPPKQLFTVLWEVAADGIRSRVRPTGGGAGKCRRARASRGG